MSCARLAVVARWTVSTAISLGLSTLHGAKFAGWALGLHSASAVRTTRAKVVVGRDSSHLGTKESVWASCAGGFTPATVSRLLADLDVVIGVVDAITFGDGGAVL